MNSGSAHNSNTESKRRTLLKFYPIASFLGFIVLWLIELGPASIRYEDPTQIALGILVFHVINLWILIRCLISLNGAARLASLILLILSLLSVYDSTQAWL